MSVTLSLNTPVPHTPIYDALLAERGTPLPEAESGEVTPVPSHSLVTGVLSRELLSLAERAATAAEAYGEEADGIASDVGRIHETTCSDIRRMHHQAQINLGLVQVTNPAAYLDEIDVWDVARIHDVPPDMVDTAVKLPPRALQPQTPEEWLPVARKILDGMTEEIDGSATHGSATVVGVDPATNDPEKTMVITKVTVDEDGHPVTFSVHGSKPPLFTASHSPDDEAPLSMPPRYYETLKQLREMGGTTQGQALPPEYAARLAEERAVLAEKPVEPYFTALAEAYEHDVVLALHGADDGERGDQALADYIGEIVPKDDEMEDEFGSYLDEALKDPEFREAYSSVQGQIVIVDMLALVGEDVTLEQVSSWTDEQRAEVVNWAGLMHLDAADNDVTVPPRPACLDDEVELDRANEVTHVIIDSSADPMHDDECPGCQRECTGAQDCPAAAHVEGCFVGDNLLTGTLGLLAGCDSTLDCTAAEHDGACLSVLGRVPVKFWICPDHRKGIVEWDGDTAVCMEDGCKKTSETPREADGE